MCVLLLFDCIHSSSYSKDVLSFDNFVKLSILIKFSSDTVGEGLLRTRIPSNDYKDLDHFNP